MKISLNGTNVFVRRWVFLPALLFLANLSFAGSATAQEPSKSAERSKRAVTVADAISMTKLGDPSYWNGAPSRGLVAHFSPDGSKFVVVLRKGNLEQNTNEYTLLLWHTKDVFRRTSPDVLLMMSSSSNRPAIQDVKWLPDNQTIEFLGETPGEQGQIYAFDIKSSKLKRVSKCAGNLLAYSTTPRGDRVAYVAEASAEPLFDDRAERTGVQVSSQDLYKLLSGQKGEYWGHETRLFLQSKVGPPHWIRTTEEIDYEHFSISPDGKYILALFYVVDPPESWKEYSDPDMQSAISEKHPLGQHTWLTRYELIDTSTEESRILVDVPEKRWKTAAVWSPDSRSIVIASTYLPLTSAEGEQRKLRQSVIFAAEVKVPSGEITPIIQGDMRLVDRDAKTGQLLFESPDHNEKSQQGVVRRLCKVSGECTRTDNISAKASLPEIILDEDMNTPPRIVAVDPTSQQRATLLELNPQFALLKFGRVEEITWKSSDGLSVQGGLYYPIDYVPGRKYPLVIQTHGWTRDRFWIDGPWTTAFAAQPLAGRGIMVLQAEHWMVDDSWWSRVMDSPEEVDREVSIYAQAIDSLDKQGLIDREHIGIIGFSRTCLYIKYALTHSVYRFAAASITDGVDGGYFQYVVGANNPGTVRFSEDINGGTPFGDGLRSWLKRSPSFGIDRVSIPVRIVAPRVAAVLQEWEWFALSLRLGKPVEMVMMRDGDHLLQKPWERMISQQGNVDWFCFWLKNEEDPDSSKTDQYKRWRRMRDSQDLRSNITTVP